jgi:hypothetical protein
MEAINERDDILRFDLKGFEMATSAEATLVLLPAELPPLRAQRVVTGRMLTSPSVPALVKLHASNTVNESRRSALARFSIKKGSLHPFFPAQAQLRFLIMCSRLFLRST